MKYASDYERAIIMAATFQYVNRELPAITAAQAELALYLHYLKLIKNMDVKIEGKKYNIQYKDKTYSGDLTNMYMDIAQIFLEESDGQHNKRKDEYPVDDAGTGTDVKGQADS